MSMKNNSLKNSSQRRSCLYPDQPSNLREIEFFFNIWLDWKRAVVIANFLDLDKLILGSSTPSLACLNKQINKMTAKTIGDVKACKPLFSYYKSYAAHVEKIWHSSTCDAWSVIFCSFWNQCWNRSFIIKNMKVRQKYFVDSIAI